MKTEKSQALIFWNSLMAICSIAIMTSTTALAQPPQNQTSKEGLELDIITHPDGKQQLKWKSAVLKEEGVLDIYALPAGTNFYTWATPENVQRWVQTQGPDQGELDFLVEEGQGIAGGGFYASLDSMDSMTYGKALAVFKAETEVKLVDPISSKDPDEQRKFNGMLSSLGISGGLFTFQEAKKWVLIVDRLPLQGTRKGTLNDALNNRRTVPLDLRSINELNQKFGGNLLDMIFERKTFQSIFESELINASVDFWGTFLEPVFSKISTASKPAQDFIKNLAEKNKEILLQTISGRFDLKRFNTIAWDMPVLEIDQPLVGVQIFDGVAFLGLQKALELQMPNALFSGAAALSPADLTALPENSFGARLTEALSFIDYSDLMVEISKGSAAPWTRYDTLASSPLAVRWKAAQAILPSTPSQPVEHLTALNSALIGAKTKFRQNEILAGGQLAKDAKSGFYRVDSLQLVRLQANPFLTIETQPDRESQPENPTTLARHEYPSVKGFTRNPNYLASYLSPDLKKELQAALATGDLARPESATFKELNQKMMQELVTWAHARSFGNHGLLYQWLISIHPFEDYNAPTMRLYYQQLTGKPFFLPTADQELLMAPSEFNYALAVGARQYNLLTRAIVQEQKQSPSFPKFYDLPEWFQIAKDVETVPENRTQWMASLKRYFRSPEAQKRIQEKRHTELFLGCNGALRKVQ